MSRLLALLRGEPVLLAAVVDLIVAIGVILGTGLDPGQVASIVAAVAAVTAIVARHWTTPASDPTVPDEPKPTTTLNRL